MRQNIVNRFLRYVKVDTMSKPQFIDRRPSTEGQVELLSIVKKELLELGLNDIFLDPNGYLIARIPSNLPKGKRAPTIGFMAHVDVADDIMGDGVKARLIENYDGKDINLNDNYTLKVEENPHLLNHIGEQIIVTDGTTLLGGDNKAGVAILVSLAEQLFKSQREHGEVELIFTTDEETGRGMDDFNIKLLNSKFCYTVDGSAKGEVEAECFNAATVRVNFYGVPFHLGAARGKMVNSVAMAASFICALPRNESPEATDGRYGYYSVDDIKGSIENTEAIFYLRDFDFDNLTRRIKTLEKLAKVTKELFVGGDVEIESEIVYRNMYDAIKKEPKVMGNLFAAAKKLNIPLTEKIIRGGTDGARLAEMGIPAPNIYTGSYNLHSRYEHVVVSTMLEAAKLVEELVYTWAGDEC
ncbi:MAG: peptidase T [Sphaerochaetaceae bacterium]